MVLRQGPRDERGVGQSQVLSFPVTKCVQNTSDAGWKYKAWEYVREDDVYHMTADASALVAE